MYGSPSSCLDETRGTVLLHALQQRSQLICSDKMSHRPSSIYGSISSSQSSALQTRINQKRLELENLQQLRDLSAQLANQMSTLEEKLAILRDGTESVAEVLKNWNNVLAVLKLVGKELPKVVPQEDQATQLPETLVRIPVGSEVKEGEWSAGVMDELYETCSDNSQKWASRETRRRQSRTSIFTKTGRHWSTRTETNCCVSSTCRTDRKTASMSRSSAYPASLTVEITSSL